MSETIIFSLLTNILTKNVTNSYGYMNDSTSAFRFDNINLRLLLGDLYIKYTTFNIYLITLVKSSGQNGTALKFLNIKLRGLKFVNDGYDYTWVNPASVSQGIINMSSGYSNFGLTNLPININNTFKCVTELVSLDIQFFM